MAANVINVSQVSGISPTVSVANVMVTVKIVMRAQVNVWSVQILPMVTIAIVALKDTTEIHC